MNPSSQSVLASPDFPLWSQLLKPRKEPRPYFVTVKLLNPMSDNKYSDSAANPSTSRTIQASLSPKPSLTVAHGAVGNAYAKRVMQRLALAETKEALVSFRDDYRIAWLTVLHASEGMPNAWEFSFWQYLGKHPDKLIPEFIQRQDSHRLMEVPDYDPTVKLHPQTTGRTKKGKSA